MLFAPPFASSGHASVVLTYDSPTIHLAPGNSAEIGATLSVINDGNAFSGGLVTDGNARIIVGGFTFPAISVIRPTDINALILGTPAHTFEQLATFTLAGPTILANLDLLPGSSFHFDLAKVALDPTLPGGTYTTDIGVNQECIGFCFGSPFFLPNFADAGVLTFDVETVPEPASLLLLLTGLAAFGVAQRFGRKPDKVSA